ncbi:hypothetical protein [Gloeothece verrucosa]|uniref:Uncharacterized protein n=1 Tax=Gloeothece verrucosa (strain PCC 7822) TaxID=497965 RepID=E0UM99_GLOV7|nr:hypothetical protein [Gloeothece verrucosa]ADN18079.1 hypothetical protein Cyan7822_6279 [Gloeothece verrucosa PCC 7822]
MLKLLSLVIALAIARPALAFEVPANQLRSGSTTIRVAPGQATAINFENGEVIDHFIISDDSRLVYNTDKEPGQAQTLILREIKPLIVQGATFTSGPNVLINTQSPDGTRNLYQFQVQFVRVVAPSERVIRVVAPSYSPAQQFLQTALGTATLDDVQEGLVHILKTGQASPDDPKIQSIQSCLELARQMPLERAAKQSNVSWDSLVRLGEIGLQIKSESSL